MDLTSRPAARVGLRIGGALGAVLLLSAPYTLWLTARSPGWAAAKAATGAILVALFFALGRSKGAVRAPTRSVRYALRTAALVLGALGLGVAANYLAAAQGPRWDLTSDKLFTLHAQTTTALQRLEAPVLAVGLFAEGDPSRDAWRELLSRYRRAAPERFRYELKSASADPALAQQLQLAPGQSAVALISEPTSQLRQVVKQPTEEELTTALLRLSGEHSPRVYFVTGHGEWALSPGEEDPRAARTGLAKLAVELAREGYDSQALNLAGVDEVPKDAALVALAGAKYPLSDGERAALERYLEAGGRVAVFAEPLFENGLDPLLSSYGLSLQRGVVADRRYSAESPYDVLSLFFSKHEVVRDLGQLNVQLKTARAIRLLREGTKAGAQAQPLVFTSPEAWIESTPGERPELSEAETTGRLVLVAAATRDVEAGPTRRTAQARLIVFGDSELLVDAAWGTLGNRNLVLNAFAWASARPGRILLRPPDRDTSSLQLAPAALARLRFWAMDVLPLAFLALGLSIWLARKDR